MSRKFTSREKILLYILVCVTALTLAVVFLLLPGMEKLSADNEKLSAAEAKQEEAKSAVYRAEKLEGQLGQMVSDIFTMSSAYYNTMTPEDADVILSGIVSRYGFTPSSLEISPIKVVNLQKYVPGTTEETAPSGNEEEDEKNAPDYALRSYIMTISATGNNNQFPALCSEISKNASMHLVSYSLQNVVTEEEVPDNSTPNANTNGNTNTDTNTNNTTGNGNNSNSNTNTPASAGSILSGLLSEGGTKTVTKSTYEISISVEVFTYDKLKSMLDAVDSLESQDDTQENAAPETNAPNAAPEDTTSNTTTENQSANEQSTATAAPATADSNTAPSNGTKENKNQGTPVAGENNGDYILNTSTGYFHVKTCSKVGQMAQENKRTFLGSTVKDMRSKGYKTCNECLPENG